jgi:hypothetical protein
MEPLFRGTSDSGAERAALLALLVAATAAVPAQAVEDTGTPGNGKWEINLGASGIRTSNRWEAAAPEAEINYGLGDQGQVQLNVPFATVHRYGDSSKSGLGASVLGYKWRFFGQEGAGLSMSTFPQYSWNLLPSSVRRGIVAPGRQFLLPLQVGLEQGRTGVFGEIAHNFIEMGADEWSLGVKAKRPCATSIACYIEVERTFVPHEPRETTVRAGMTWDLNQTFAIKGAIGRDFGKSTEDQRHLILSVALQFVH